MDKQMETLRRFALTRDVEEGDAIVGYGMVLPDGSAYSVSWPRRNGGLTTYSTSTAEDAARLRNADLWWIDD